MQLTCNVFSFTFKILATYNKPLFLDSNLATTNSSTKKTVSLFGREVMLLSLEAVEDRDSTSELVSSLELKSLIESGESMDVLSLSSSSTP